MNVAARFYQPLGKGRKVVIVVCLVFRVQGLAD